MYAAGGDLGGMLKNVVLEIFRQTRLDLSLYCCGSISRTSIIVLCFNVGLVSFVSNVHLCRRCRRFSLMS